MLEKYSHSTQINFNKINCPLEMYNPCGIDIGYSAMKIKSQYAEVVIPSLVYKVQKDASLYIDDLDIRYRDENGDIWFAGSLAKRALRRDDTMVRSGNLLSRQRIQSDEFITQLRISMFMAKLMNLTDDGYEVDDKPLKIQTGLPPEFYSADSQELKDRFVGTHTFGIKIGNRPWIDVSIEVKKGDVYSTRQPFGTLIGCCVNDQGVTYNEDFLKRNVLIVDIGFHTTDTFLCIQGAAEGLSLTWENFSMQNIYSNTCQDIAKNTNNKADISIYYLEKSLDKGIVYYGPKKEAYDFVQDFENNIKKVCHELTEQLKSTYKNMEEVDAIVVTGGTGAALFKYFEECFGEFGGTELVLANGENAAFANVNGYYNLLVSRFA